MQKAALAVGVVFAAVGVLGFVPGITTNYADLAAAGHESEAMLLGLFQVSVLHNMVHLVFGVIGIAVSRRPEASLTYLLGGGIVYLVLLAYGLLVDRHSEANIVPLNAADDWLHLGLGLGMIALGLLSTRRHGAGHRCAAEPSRQRGSSDHPPEVDDLRSAKAATSSS